MMCNGPDHVIGRFLPFSSLCVVVIAVLLTTSCDGGSSPPNANADGAETAVDESQVNDAVNDSQSSTADASADSTDDTEPTAPPDDASAEGNGAWFEQVATSAGIVFSHDSGHDGENYYMPECVCGGCALFDMDSDGDLDAYLVQSGRITADRADRPGNQLFENQGDGTFIDITDQSGTADRGYGMGCTVGDYNNDGYPDLYVTNVDRNTLYRNNGDGTFTDVTESSGAGDESWSASAAFVDYDADGDLDLYVTNYLNWSPRNELGCFSPMGDPDYCSPRNYRSPARDTFYRNEGDGTFTDVTEEAGMHLRFGNGLGVVCGDFNADGFIDIFVANDGTDDIMWRNEGDGTFTEVGQMVGVSRDIHGQAKAGMGADATDFDDDGDLDLLVVNLSNETDSFHRNEGDYFIDETALIGLGHVTRAFTRFGMSIVDLNNDGLLDYFVANGRVGKHSVNYSDDPYAEPNILMRGTSSGRFEEVKPRGGTAELLVASARGAAFGDVDNDGDVDVLIINRDGPAHLLKNISTENTTDAHNWVQFRIVNEHGYDAIGAELRLRIGDRTLRRDVRAAYSYCSANDPRLHIGLGEATQIDSIEITWPDRTTTTHEGPFDAGALHTITRS